MKYLRKYLRPILLGVGLALVIDLAAAWIFCSLHDGPDFPY